PVRPAGQETSAALALVFGCGDAVVPVGAVVVGAVGPAAVWGVAATVGPASVRTIVLDAELEAATSPSADATPAASATASARGGGQPQSPGYRPTRLRQRAPSRALRPCCAGSRSPHSRQYSWPSAYGVSQRGQRRSSSGGGTSALLVGRVEDRVVR